MHSHKRWHYVDETQRREWQNPEDILLEIGAKTGITFMDIGCGDGYFTLPAARIVGPSGLVYALDANEEAITEIGNRAQAEGLSNIIAQTGKAEDTIFCESCADIVFFGIVLHDFQNASKVLENARKMLKPDATLVDLDWKKIRMGLGPPLSVRFDEFTAAQMIEGAGFHVESIKDAGQYHYIIRASR